MTEPLPVSYSFFFFYFNNLSPPVGAAMRADMVRRERFMALRAERVTGRVQFVVSPPLTPS
jgi:hypothetical protein